MLTVDIIRARCEANESHFDNFDVSLLLSDIDSLNKERRLIGLNRQGNALLCRFAAETPIPAVVIAKTTDELRHAIADEWLGEEHGPEMDSILASIRKHDFSADDAREIRFDLEMGCASFEDVLA